ncbi:MAG TPA: type II CAAX endopeptidase family protein [Gammaproteobacteria bacterium]|nr:type II CAAX endopeptidase family protein [Gammaproteobacteria bacterium]
MSESADHPAPPRPVAPAWHTAVLLLVLFTVSAVGTVNRGNAALRHFPHLGYYAYVIVMEGVLLALCLWKVNAAFRGYLARILRERGGWLRDLVTAISLVVIVIFILSLLLRFLFGFQGWESLQDLKPTDGVQRALWLGMSLVAALCEEIVFRGYFLQQFTAWTRSLGLGVVAQAAVFGLAHGYQGWKNMVLIGCLGLLLGAVTAARKNLRPAMLAHALLDSLSAFF